MTRVCTQCHKELPLDAFGQKRGRRDGTRSECKACATEAKRLARATPEAKAHEAAITRAYRARKKSGTSREDPPKP